MNKNPQRPADMDKIFSKCINPATKAIEDINEAGTLPNRTKKYLDETQQTPSDLKAIAKRDALCTKDDEVKDGS